MLSNNLPEDLVEEILMRLSVKSLLRFKCVSKSWYALIADTFFITKQLEYSNSIGKNRSLKLIFQLHCPCDLPPWISVISKYEPYVLPNIELPLILEKELGLMFIYDQCNGIFCLYGVFNKCTEGRLILWNIATKEVKVIFDSSWRKPKNIDDSMIGFGFDPIIKDYKVVRFIQKPWVEEEEEEHLIEVYNLSTNSWRKIDVEVPNYELTQPSWSAYLNGFYHWLALARNNDEIGKALILSFDFSKEVFRKIQLPYESNPSSFTNVVVVNNESLACVATYYSTLKFEVWVMNEYGVESTWTKKFEIGPLPKLESLLGFWGNDVILDSHGQLISYNLHNHHRQRLQVHVPKLTWMFDYIESLVPLTQRGRH